MKIAEPVHVVKVVSTNARLPLAAIAFTVALCLSGCGLEFSKIDERVELLEQEWKSFYYEYDPSIEELAVEIAHISGTPMDFYVVDKDNYSRFENGWDFQYFSALSSRSISHSFISPWVRLDTSGFVYFILRPEDVEDGRWSSSVVQVKIKSKLLPH
jgi:hypothetical protein